MSIHVSSMAWKFSLSSCRFKQKSNIKLVLIKLCDNASDEGYCWPSMSRIAKECELSRRSVIDQINKLKELGLIAVNHRYNNNEQTSNGYQVNLELLARGELLAPPSECCSLPQCKCCTQNRNLTINESSNIQASNSFDGVSVNELNKDDFQYCYYMISVMIRSKYDFYIGKLTMEEWISAESKMADVEIEAQLYVNYWISKHAKTMRKKASLTDLLSDKNGVDFEDYYRIIEDEFDL